MSDQFYITIPSNTHKDNTASNFRVVLPQRIRLEGEWEVALAEIIYPHSWFHLHEKNSIFMKTLSKEGTLKLNPGYYSDINTFLNDINQGLIAYSALHMPELQNLIFSYNKKKNIVQFQLDSIDIIAITLSDELAKILGFNNRFIYYKHPEDDPYDIIGKIFEAHEEFVQFNLYYQTLFVYCNIVEDQIIGNTMAPLLRIIETQGKHGDLVCKTYDAPHYVPVLLKDFVQIEINIKTDMNELFSFMFGKVIVKLHVRRRNVL